MNKKSKINLAIILVVMIIIVLLLRTCNTCNASKSVLPTSTPSTTRYDTDILSKNIDTQKHANSASNKTTFTQHQFAAHTQPTQPRDTLSNVQKKLLSNSTIALSNQSNVQQHTSTNQLQIHDTMKKNNLPPTAQPATHDSSTHHNNADITVYKPNYSERLSPAEYANQVKRFFSSIIIDFKGINKTNQEDYVLKDIDHFKLFVKMATSQPLTQQYNDFRKKIFVRISDSTTGKLIIFKSLSTMMQSITLYNMQEIDYTLGEQADFNNADKSATISHQFNTIDNSKPKSDIVIRTEVFCQGIKIGESMTHFILDRPKK